MKKPLSEIPPKLLFFITFALIFIAYIFITIGGIDASPLVPVMFFCLGAWVSTP